MVNIVMPAVDLYNQLSGLGDTLQNNAKLQREQALKDAFKDGLPKSADGSIDFGATGNILSQHGADLGTVLTVAKLAEEQRKSREELQASKDFRGSMPGILGGAPPSAIVTPPAGQPSPPPPGAPIQPTSKVWGDKEAEDAGLYDPKPTSSYGDSLKRKPLPLPVGLTQPLQPSPQPTPVTPVVAQPQVAPPTMPEKGIDLSDKIPQLVAASSNPRLPAQDRELAKTLLTQAFAQNKEPEALQLYRVAFGQGYRGSFMDYQKANKGPAVNIDQRQETAQAKKVGDALGEVQGEDIKAGSHAISKMRQLATLNDANQAGGDDISSGPFGKAVLTGKQGLSEVLGIDTKGLPESEVIQKVGFGLATNMVKAITQRPAQMEFMKALENVPGLFMSKQGRVAMTSITLQEARAEQEIGRLAARHKDVEGGPVWQEVKDKYYDDHPLISPFTGKPFSPQDVQMLVNTSPQAPPSTAQPAQPSQQGGNVSRQGVPWSIQ